MSETSLDDVFSEQAAPTPEPVQEVAPAPVEEATGEEVAAAPAEPQDDQLDKHRKGLEAAAVAERNKRQAAEARAQALEERIRQFEAQQQAPAATQGEPDPQDPRYQENPQAYWRDLARYEARQELKQQAEADRERQQQEQNNRAQAAFMERINSLSNDGRTRYRDFDAVIDAGLGPFLNAPLQQAIGFHKKGADVAYWLGKNPAEAARIAQLHPMLMAMELGEISAKANPVPPSPIPRTLTDVRNAQGQYAPRQDGPTPLSDIFARK